MDGKSRSTVWLEAIFDVSQPYLYLIVLPALLMFALGFRSQAVVFTFGAAALFAIMGMA